MGDEKDNYNEYQNLKSIYQLRLYDNRLTYTYISF